MNVNNSYIIEENLCFLTLTEKSVSKRIIFSFLEDVKNTFISYVQTEHKEEYSFLSFNYIDGEQSLLQWLDLMHMLVLVSDHNSLFLSIDKEIQAKRKLYDQPTSSLDSYNQINESLVDIQNIMRKNIDEVVQRVEKLDRMVYL